MQTRLFLRRLAFRMVFVALLAMAATASGLLLYDQLQPTPQTSLAVRPASPETRGRGPARVSTVPKALSDLSRPPEAGRLGRSPSDQMTAKQGMPTAAGAAPQPTVENPSPQPAVDPQKRAAFRQAISQARSAVDKRDFAGAKWHLKTAEATTQDQADQSELGRLDALVGNLEEFWKGMRTIVAGLLPAEEIMLGQTPVIVVSVDADQLTVRSEGRNLTYRLYDLPRPIVEALAERGFAKHPSSRILLGTYMAMDPKGDRQRARQLWEQAAGQGDDVRELMDELGPEGRGARGGR